jgi:hypothetical protein
MEDIDFVKAYDGFWIGYFVDSYINNYLEVLTDTGFTQTFTFTLNKAGTTFVGVEFYNPRMYPLTNCHYYTYATVYLYTSSGSYLNGMYAYDWNDFNFIKYDSLAAGTYKMTVLVNWDKTYGDNDVKDYTVRVYGSQVVTISSGTSTGKYNYILTQSSSSTTNSTTTNTTNSTSNSTNSTKNTSNSTN